MYKARVDAKLRSKRLCSICTASAHLVEPREFSEGAAGTEHVVPKRDNAVQTLVETLGNVPL